MRLESHGIGSEGRELMQEKVTVAVDGGEASYAALGWAIARAKQVPSQITIMTVVSLGWYPIEGAEYDFRRSYEEAVLAAERHLESELPSVAHQSAIRHGVAAAELEKASAEAQLLVMGSNKTGKVVGAMHGTLPLKVAGSTRCPLIVVPAAWRARDGAIVVGYDDDETSELAVDFAAGEAARHDRTLRIVHGWSVPATLAMDTSWVPYDSFLEFHRSLLSSVADRVKAQWPELVVEEVLDQLPAAQALVEAASDAELLVVGSHRKGVIAGLIIGSVSHDVLMNLPCPVAVIPHPEDPTRA